MLYSSLLVLLLALVSRILNGLYTKYALKNVDSFSLFFFVNIFIALAVFPFIYKSIPLFFALPTLLLLALIGSGIVQAVSGIVSNYALQKTPVSIYTTVSQLQIVWVVLASIIFLSEKVTVQSVFGIILIIGSSLLLSGNIHIRKEVGLKPILIAVISSLVAALAILLDKTLVGTFDTLFYFFLMLTIPIFFLLPDYTRRIKFYNGQMRQHFKIYIITAFLFGLSYYSLLLLYSLPDVPLSVAYPIRSSGGIFTVALAIIIFGENKNIKRKMIATVLAIIGAILVKTA
ncbi:MAG: SMR family transporter [Candidatus Paceibacterota bacterium]